jgi:hypothetical protein
VEDCLVRDQAAMLKANSEHLKKHSERQQSPMEQLIGSLASVAMLGGLAILAARARRTERSGAWTSHVSLRGEKRMRRWAAGGWQYRKATNSESNDIDDMSI